MGGSCERGAETNRFRQHSGNCGDRKDEFMNLPAEKWRALRLLQKNKSVQNISNDPLCTGNAFSNRSLSGT